MSEPKIGKLITEADAARDAIHIAVAPVVAMQPLKPGDHIGFISAGDTETVGLVSTPIGIVDPYLTKPVKPRQRFWMHLYPGTITSLRHNWTHSAFEAETSYSDKWLRAYAKITDISYKDLLEGVGNYVEHGEYISDGSRYEGADVPDEFWEHYEAVTRKKVAEDKKGHFFSCAC